MTLWQNYVPDIVRDMNIKVFNLLARINETRKVI